MFGIISDAHLFAKNAIKPEKYKSILKTEFKDCDFIVDCGDLTDRSTLTAPQIDILSKLYQDIDKPIYLVAGNHDSLSNTTIASMFDTNSNITVIKDKPQVIDSMLFIPYTDNIKELYKQLNNLVEERVQFTFSHLNITNNIYATVPFSNLSSMFRYTENIFNGHIHMQEKQENIQGNFYNIGSCSSLTFGDEHIPCYSIYNKSLETKQIEHSLLHRTYEINEKTSINNVLSCIDDLSNYLLRCRIKLKNNPDSINIRKEIKQNLDKLDNVQDIVFSYVKDNVKSLSVKEQNKLNEIPLIEQLFTCFEQINKITLDNKIKEELL